MNITEENTKKMKYSESKLTADQFHKLTLDYLEKTDLFHRKARGQYFTPKIVREKLLVKLPKNIISPKIIDPACGTGEFLLSAKKYFRNPKLYGLDIEEKLISISKQIVPMAKLKTTDALREEPKEKFDFVIGNPPYFEFKPDQFIRSRFHGIINGRANIFSLFIKLGLDLLRDGGYLAYVVPPSMNNGAYFSKLREYIVGNANIESLEVLEEADIFHKALQKIMLLVLKKGENKGDYIFRKNGIMIFSPKAEYLKRAFRNATSLGELGFKVRTGRLVWNQHKKSLTDDPNNGVPLIWSYNIGNGRLKIPIINRKQYVKVNKYDTGPAIAVNRITGAARSARLKAAIIPKGVEFVGENHVNVIFPPEDNLFGNTKITLDEVLFQLRSERKLEVVRNITGNTQISKKELENLFPISPS